MLSLTFELFEINRCLIIMFSFALILDKYWLIMNFSLLLLVFIQLFSIKCTVIINRPDSDVINKCNLDPALIAEIASYKNMTEFIMNEITRNWGTKMFSQFKQFIDMFGARPSGSKVLEEAIDHMIDLALENGLSDVTTESVNVPHWVRGDESAVMVSPRRKNIAILGFGTSVSTPPLGITAKVIVIKSFEDLNTTNESQIRGKIVVFDPPFVSYGETVIYRSQGATRAAEKGAVAALVRSVTPFSLYTLHTGSQYYGENVTKIPTAAITHEDADLMRSLQMAGDEITLTIKMFSTFDMKISRNTILDLKGSEDPRKYVIVSGHIDSWDVGQGAMDDGGGMMISWFAPVILKYFKFTPRRTLRSILWTAEEPGLIGAAAYLKAHENELRNITYIMESDEGTFAPLGLDIAGTPKARCIIQEILKLFSPIDKITESGSPGSDITMFIKRGIPGASLLNANQRYYWYHHSEADTIAVQNETDMTHCAAFWAAVSFVIADLSIDIPG